MPRTDLLEQSATRVELDQRSRDARLRQEHVERALAVRTMPQQSLLRRFLRRLGSRICIGGRSVGGRVSSDRGRGIPGEVAGAAGANPGAPIAGWLNCPKAGCGSFLRSETTSRTVEGWNYRCGPQGVNSHILSGGQY